MEKKNLIYDWNHHTGSHTVLDHEVRFDDETLRDGLQCPSVVDPPIEKKIGILRLADMLGIQTADIGLPGAGSRAQEHAERLARTIVEEKLRILPNCAARTLTADIDPILEISDRVGIPIEASVFIGSSPIRRYAEEWSLDYLLELTEKAVTYAARRGVPVMYVTEDTTRARPEDIRRMYETAIRAGASRVCVCDTVGHATPIGAKAVVSFAKAVVDGCGGEVGIDWHGHSDRGLGVVNAFAALEAGASRLHGTALGIGERVGNCPLDLLLVNLRLSGLIENDLTHLSEYCTLVSEATGIPIHPLYPVVGRDAFRTATGVHAAAIIKAHKKGDSWLADRIYSGVPASMVGRKQEIEIGPMSGVSNILWWLATNGLPQSDDIVAAIRERAKASDRLLEGDEIRLIVRRVSGKSV
jgi:2-isopropylmalate synthase